MVKVIKNNNDEYKLLHQKSIIKRIASLFNICWVLLIVIPLQYFIYTNSNSIKEFVVVKGVYEANSALLDQYTDLSNNLVSKININKYTSKIKIPEIKLDAIEDATSKVNKTASIASKFGIKGADKVVDTTSQLQAQVDKINNQIKTETANLTKTLESDINKALKEELNNLATSSMQKQLGLSEKAYKNLLAGRYGIMSEAQRNATKSIYKEFEVSKKDTIKDVISMINKYFVWFTLAVMLVVFVVSLIPVYFVMKFSKLFTKNFNKCPYCGKVYLAKLNKLSLLGIFKFWNK